MKLIIEDDEGRKTVVPFVRDEISIGRLEGNTIRLTERNVSRHHARLVRESETIVIEDLDSYNGVLVNGERIATRSPIREGDLIEIGDYDLAVEGVPTRISEDTQPSAAMPVAPLIRSADRNATPVGVPPVTSLSGRRNLSETEAPRLIGIAGAFWGQDLRIPKTVTVIGRTEEGCDLAIDDPSISRRHAKLQLEAGIWRLYDLNSANGIEVNGKRQGFAAVKAGDIVEIGHVKFRFTAPGEAFKPPPEGATSSEEASDNEFLPHRTSRVPMIAGVLVAAAVLGVIGWIALPRLTKPRTADINTEDLCQKGEFEAGGRNWAAAIKDLTIAKQLGQPCSFPVDATIATARRNQQVKATMDGADKNIIARRFRDAVTALQAVPADSVYASEAKLKAVETAAQGVKQLSADARSSIDQGQLDEASTAIDDLKQLDPEAATLPLLEKELAEHRRASASRPASGGTHATSTTQAVSTVAVVEKPTPTAATEARKSIDERNADAEADIADGIKKIQGGDLIGGVARLQSAIAAGPETSLVARAHRNIGVAYAHVNRMDDAIPHLKIYLKLAPDSAEHDKVQKIINDYEGRKN